MLMTALNLVSNLYKSAIIATSLEMRMVFSNFMLCLASPGIVLMVMYDTDVLTITTFQLFRAYSRAYQAIGYSCIASLNVS